MFGSEFFDSSFWWVFPLVMVVFCFFMMGRMGTMMCGSRTHSNAKRHHETSDSALDIVDKRYALGEIGREEYEEKKRDLAQTQSALRIHGTHINQT